MATISNRSHSRPAIGMVFAPLAILALLALLAPAATAAAQAPAGTPAAAQDAQLLAAGDLADMSLEELANVRVTSVTGRPRSKNNVAASVFVITREDIRRSAATSLPAWTAWTGDKAPPKAF